MMRSIHILFVVMAMMILPSIGFADDYSDCRSACAAEKNNRNMGCPSPYDAANAGQERLQCLKENQAAFEDCISHCPATPPLPPASEEQQPSPPAMAY